MIAFTSDGALRTGLSARPATNGTSVEVFGAVTDSILVAGEIHPVADLDAAVRAHPDVADAAVYPLKDDLLGSRLGVAVVGQPGKRLTLEALHAWLEEAGLSPVVMPTTLLSVPEIRARPTGRSCARRSSWPPSPDGGWHLPATGLWWPPFRTMRSARWPKP